MHATVKGLKRNSNRRFWIEVGLPVARCLAAAGMLRYTWPPGLVRNRLIFLWPPGTVRMTLIRLVPGTDSKVAWAVRVSILLEARSMKKMTRDWIINPFAGLAWTRMRKGMAIAKVR